MAKVILISQYPLPYSKIGSWPNIYKNYLQADHQIDYIICEEPATKFPTVKYGIAKNNVLVKIRRRLLDFYRIGYIDELKKIVKENPEEKFIIQVVDNFRIVRYINQFLDTLGIRQKCYIQVFYHGFSPFVNAVDYLNFYETIDELILLTHDSYKTHKNFYTSFPCKTSILYNGIDTQRFHLPTNQDKEKLKLESGLEGKKIFMWCAQDRPKKGLSLILDVWKKIYANHKNTVLIVIGAKRDIAVDGVIFLGRIPNDDLPKYYQMSDCYLFPTLCHEGFPLSLTEALNCGCYCIASNQGGVPEVLQYGRYGRIIENPNYVSEWETAINNYLDSREQPIQLTSQIYRFEDWVSNMNAIIKDAKASLA